MAQSYTYTTPVQPILINPQPRYYQAQQPVNFNNNKNCDYIETGNNHIQIVDTGKYSNDRSFSLTFLILGIFTFFPFIVNIIYLRSPDRKARKYAVSSVIVGTLYLLSSIITWSVFYGKK